MEMEQDLETQRHRQAPTLFPVSDSPAPAGAILTVAEV
jgi:hypothetical protein